MNRHIKKLILLSLLTISFSVHSGMADWEKLPKQEPRIMMENTFDASFWVVQHIKIDPMKYDGENIRNISSKNGDPTIYEDKHHKYICINNKSTYLHIYDSGWGPGYTLTKKPFVWVEECEAVTQKIALGSGIYLGMEKIEIETILGKKLPTKVADLRFEEIIPSDSCKSGIWHAVDLKIIFEDQRVVGVYFDDHGEPYGECN